MKSHQAKEEFKNTTSRSKGRYARCRQIIFDSHEVSASSSFLRFILSFRPSASRRAAAIFACICSPDISDIAESDYADEGKDFAVKRHNEGGWWGGSRGKSRGFERPPPGSRAQRIATTTQVKKAGTGKDLDYDTVFFFWKMQAA